MARLSIIAAVALIATGAALVSSIDSAEAGGGMRRGASGMGGVGQMGPRVGQMGPRGGQMGPRGGQMGPLVGQPGPRGGYVRPPTFGQSAIGWGAGKVFDYGVTKVIPVYGPIKTTYDAVTTLQPRIQQTLDNSRRSQELREQNIAPAVQAIEDNKAQSGGVFSPNLNQDWME